MKKIIITLLIIITAGPISYFSLLMYINNKAELDTKVTSEVILVLGGIVYSGTDCYGPICKQINFVPNRHYNPCLVARINHAIMLYKDHYAPKILMSGGADKEDNTNEAERMRKIAIEAGIPSEDILVENKSTSTYENFAFSKKILQKANLHSIIIVTDPYHNARAELIARKQKFAYSLSPAVESACWEQDKNKPFTNRDSRREVLAIIAYIILQLL